MLSTVDCKALCVHWASRIGSHETNRGLTDGKSLSKRFVRDLELSAAVVSRRSHPFRGAAQPKRRPVVSGP